MPVGLTRLDLLWIKSFLSKCVVHGPEQEALFAVTEKVDTLIERTSNGIAGQPEHRSVA